MIYNGFLVVDSESSDISPTWYNINDIKELVEVTVPQASRNQTMRIF